MTKTYGETIILHMCTKNNNDMMYGSWNIGQDRQDFLSFWTIFSPFTPLTTWKVKILKNGKSSWRYYHFTHVYHKWKSYDVWFLRYGAWQTEFFVILDHFLPFYPNNNPKNQNFEKNEKKAWRYYHVTHVVYLGLVYLALKEYFERLHKI